MKKIEKAIKRLEKKIDKLIKSDKKVHAYKRRR